MLLDKILYKGNPLSPKSFGRFVPERMWVPLREGVPLRISTDDVLMPFLRRMKSKEYSLL